MACCTMSRMSAPAVLVQSRLARSLPWALMVLVVLIAVLGLGVMLWASGYGQGRSLTSKAMDDIGFTTWTLIPFVARGLWSPSPPAPPAG